MKQVLPFAKAGAQALRLVNGVASIARVFFGFIPNLQETVETLGRGCTFLGTETSVADYKTIDEKLKQDHR